MKQFAFIYGKFTTITSGNQFTTMNNKPFPADFHGWKINLLEIPQGKMEEFRALRSQHITKYGLIKPKKFVKKVRKMGIPVETIKIK